MKRFFVPSRSAKQSGFTLVELLVVIGIIAILAGVLLSAGTSALRAAQRTKAQNLAVQIQTGALNYYTEYSVYPVPTGSPATDYFISDGKGDAGNWGILIEALCGNISPYKGTSNITGLTVSNTRSIAFLQLKSNDVDINDAPLNPLPYNAANPYFNIGIDNDYSGIVGDTGTPPGAGIPNFSTSAQGAMKYYANGTSGGIAVWANCNTTATTNPGFFVHTY